MLMRSRHSVKQFFEVLIMQECQGILMPLIAKAACLDA